MELTIGADTLRDARARRATSLSWSATSSTTRSATRRTGGSRASRHEADDDAVLSVARHRRRDPDEGPAAHLRALLPRRPGALARDRRDGARPRDRQARRREPRGQRRRRRASWAGHRRSTCGSRSPTTPPRGPPRRPPRRMLPHRMTTLFLIRHGLTADTGKRLYGQTSGVDLDDRGRAQADALAERFGTVRLTAIYSSPLERCVQTVEPLAAAQRLDRRPTRRSSRWTPGRWTGRRSPRCGARSAGRRSSELPSHVPVPGRRIVHPRAGARRRRGAAHRAPAPTGTSCVATHGDIVRILVTHLTGAPLDAFQRIRDRHGVGLRGVPRTGACRASCW